MDIQYLNDIDPTPLDKLPEEPRQIITLMRAGQPVPEDVFFLRPELTLEQKKRRVLLWQLASVGLWLFGTGLACVAPQSVTMGVRAGIFGLFLAIGALCWWLMAGEARNLVDDPFYCSMVCTPEYLAVIDMGMVRLFHLKEYISVTRINRHGKYGTGYGLKLNGPTYIMELGSVSDTSEESADAFAKKLHNRIQELQRANTND